MDKLKLGLSFEMKEVEVKETYVDEDGLVKERIKKVLLPTGKILPKGEENDDKKE